MSAPSSSPSLLSPSSVMSSTFLYIPPFVKAIGAVLILQVSILLYSSTFGKPSAAATIKADNSTDMRWLTSEGEPIVFLDNEEDSCQRTPCATVRTSNMIRWRVNQPKTALYYHNNNNNNNNSSSTIEWTPHNINDVISFPCLHGKRVLFLGDSHLRDVLREMLDVLGFRNFGNEIHRQKHTDFEFYLPPPLDITFGFIFMSLWFDANTRALLPSTATKWTDVIFTHGMWHLLYMDAEAAKTVDAFTANFVRFINLVRAHANNKNPRRLSSSPPSFYFWQLRPLHPPTSKSQTSEFWDACLTPQRVEAYRAIHACALQRALARLKLATSSFPVIDVAPIVNNSVGRAFVLNDGHHYGRGTPVHREMVFMLIKEICQTKKKNESNNTNNNNNTVSSACDIPPYPRSLICHCRLPIHYHEPQCKKKRNAEKKRRKDIERGFKLGN
eukprot:PhM_4_TR3321/c0_g1_i2/m.27721